MSHDPHQQGCVAGPPTNFREYLMGGSLFPPRDSSSVDEEEHSKIKSSTSSPPPPPPISSRIFAFVNFTTSLLLFCILLGRLTQTLTNIDDHVGIGKYWVELGDCSKYLFNYIDLPSLIIDPVNPVPLKCDRSDSDWDDFDHKCVILGIAMTVFVVISQITKRFLTRANSILKVHALLACGIVGYLLTWGFFIVIGILGVCFLFILYVAPQLMSMTPKRLFSSSMTIFRGKLIVDFVLIGVPTLILIAAHQRRGFVSGFFEHFSFIAPTKPSQINWQDLFRFQLLKIISFGYDYLEAYRVESGVAGEVVNHSYHYSSNKNKNKTANFPAESVVSDHYARAEQPQPLSSFTFINFIAYSFYLPLFITGPFCSFNAFMSYHDSGDKHKENQQQQDIISGEQQQKQQQTSSLAKRMFQKFKTLFVYALTGYVGYFTTRMLTAMIYMNSFIAQPKVVLLLPVFDQTALVFFSLLFLFLKHVVAWKFFRFFALLDDVEVIEEVQTPYFIFSAFSAIEVFRKWNASMHHFAMRYLYVPLGGKQSKVSLSLFVSLLTAMWIEAKIELLVFAFVCWIALIFDKFILEFFVNNNHDNNNNFSQQKQNHPIVFQLQKSFLGSISIFLTAFAFSYGFGAGALTLEIVYNVMISGSVGTILFWLIFGVCSRGVAMVNQELEENKKRMMVKKQEEGKEESG